MFFFFSSRRRHTRLQGDWSSDVCSSDLTALELTIWLQQESGAEDLCLAGGVALNCVMNARLRDRGPFEQIGRASGRERGEISVVAGSLKKKKQKMRGCEVTLKYVLY